MSSNKNFTHKKRSLVPQINVKSALLPSDNKLKRISSLESVR
jgi:hypothetical protein